jgi:arylsulfatase A-like enzyme
MFRANRLRGEVPTASGSGTPSPSLEGWLALGLCLMVILSSAALLRRSSDFARALVDLAREDPSERPRIARRAAALHQRPRPEFVILISLDTLRADRLSLYGYGRETAPHLRALGEQGLVFRTVGAQSSHTLSSHKSLLTGKYPNTLLLEGTGADLFELTHVSDPRQFLSDAFTHVHGTLAEAFQRNGYATLGLTDGAWMSRAAGFQHGFDTFDDSGGGLEHILPRALGWLDEHRGHAFLFLHAYDVHCPYPTREPFDSAFCEDHARHIDLSDKCGKGPLFKMALSEDDYLGGFFEALRARGLFERALIVVLSDHGESLGERGVVGHGGLYLEQLLVPLIVKPPQDWNLEPVLVNEPAELVDLFPTLLALCDIPVPAGIDGRSLLPILQRGVKGRDFLVAQTTYEEAPLLRSSAAKRTLLRPGRWQVIQDAANQEASFFSVENDPLGLSPLPVEAREVAGLLEVLLRQPRARTTGALQPAPAAGFTDDLIRELGRLGYGAAPGAGDDRSTALR